MNLLGGVPRKHKNSMPVVKKRAYMYQKLYMDGCCKVRNYSSLTSVRELREELVDHDCSRQLQLGIFLACQKHNDEKSERKAVETWFRVYDKELGSGKVSNKDVLSKKVCDKDFRFGKLKYALIS
ncbi:hypothetical protein MKW98_015170 [Papaver atlanticum]|uniref:Uncharacterized protein n=1 Tax=Papaver atlanticum TaxID=357466 RepID=A0AAD4T6M6_9MAGN|nr:hypothetical protein MKW98_015170 [Papaver atlanticum]